MNINEQKFSSIQEMTGQLLQNRSNPIKPQNMENPLSFNQILKDKELERSGELKFSKHANERLATRNIDLSGEQLKRLEDGTNKARAKGIQESLVMVDNLAFIVNVKNSTVITAVGETDDAIFTNIDGAVIS